MLKMLRDELRAGEGDRARPASADRPGPRFRGKVEIDFSRCTLDGACAEACPTPAIRIADDRARNHATFTLDLGPCIFCGLCEEACPEGAIRLTPQFELAATAREELVTRGFFGNGAHGKAPAAPAAHEKRETDAAGDEVRRRALKLLGRSLHVRAVDAGSCNGCEMELRAAAGPIHDLERFGIELVIDPAHADLLLVTGPVTLGMTAALEEAYALVQEPRLVVALGACAIGGGIHAGSYAQSDGLPPSIPADVFVPGCPPRPQAILQGLLLAIGRAEQKVRAGVWRGAYPPRS